MAPENTLAAFERGLAEGADILESDVHLTRDGVPVLIHDPLVDRCTNGSGAVDTFDLPALQALDASRSFAHSGDGSSTAATARIPTLQEALETFPEAHLNLELKAPAPRLIDRCLDVIQAAGRAQDILLTAEDDRIMTGLRERVADRSVDVALGASLGEVVSFVRAAIGDGRPARGPMALQIPAQFGGQPLATTALIEFAHAEGVQVHVWTINDPLEIEALLDVGVDGIVSDFPARVVKAREARS